MVRETRVPGENHSLTQVTGNFLTCPSCISLMVCHLLKYLNEAMMNNRYKVVGPVGIKNSFSNISLYFKYFNFISINDLCSKSSENYHIAGVNGIKERWFGKIFEGRLLPWWLCGLRGCHWLQAVSHSCPGLNPIRGKWENCQWLGVRT